MFSSCKYCEREFDNHGSLGQHLDTKHPLIECRYCSKSFRNSHSLRTHSEAMHLSYKCRDCGKGFISRPALNSHSKAAHFFTTLLEKIITYVREMRPGLSFSQQ
ncbi:hypothetical protein C8Q75DRAFT_762101 [Abortiporus biennis]|nr:hypothetical protein C8Q75DRAFT_762101 [Abortiporus biennis]